MLGFIPEQFKKKLIYSTGMSGEKEQFLIIWIH